MRPAPGSDRWPPSLFGACRPACEDLDQVPILTEAAPDPVAWQAEIAGTLSDFLAWSGEGTCLSAVSVGLPSAIQGDPRSPRAFDRWQRRIHLAPDLDLQAVAPVLQHELCHAWDASRGFVSDEHPELFPAEQLPAACIPPPIRQGPAAREVFAFLCGVGPVDPALVRSLDAGGCDAGLTPGWRFVLDQVYPEAPAGEPAALGAALPAAIRQVPIADPPAQRIYDVAFVGDGLWILSLEHPPPTWELNRLDLLTGEWTTHRPLPATDPLPGAFLVAGPEEGRLVARWGEVWTAFRLPPDGGEASPVVSVGAPPSFESGALWWQGRLWQLVGDGLLEHDPIDGSSGVHPFPEGLSGLSNRSLHPRSGGLGFVGTVGGHAVQGFTDGGGAWSHAAAPTRRPLVRSWPMGAWWGEGICGASACPRWPCAAGPGPRPSCLR